MASNISSTDKYITEQKTSIEGELQMLVEGLQRIVGHVGAVLDVRNCAIALLDGSGDFLLTTAALQNHDHRLRRRHFQLNRGIAGWVAQRKEPLIINNTLLDRRFKRFGHMPIGSMMCVPLLDGSTFMGTLTATSEQTEIFDPKAARMMIAFAEQATLAVCHATTMRAVSRMKTQFVATLTHELRAPLNTINGYLDLVLDGAAGDLNEEMREFLVRARTSSEHLYGLLEDQLLIARADTGQWKLSREIIELPEIVENAVEELELTARDNGVVLKINNADHLPTIYADPVRLQQVLRNLLSNALRHTTVGGQITITTRVTDNTYEGISREHAYVLLLQVCDTGSGIAPEYLERIFDRFYQIPGSNRKGQGLGLAIVKMVVEAHGGRVFVESAADQGSTFTCVLPGLLS